MKTVWAKICAGFSWLLTALRSLLGKAQAGQVAPGWQGWKYLTVGVMLFGAVYLAWSFYAPKPPQLTSQYAVAQPAHGVEHTETVPVEIKVPLQVVPKATASKKLKLPKEVADNEAKVVTSTADIPASKGGATAVTVLDTRTGVTEMLVKDKPRAWASFERGTEVGLRYGYSTDAGQEVAIYGRRDVARIGNVYLSGYAEGNIHTLGGSEAKAMVDVSMRW